MERYTLQERIEMIKIHYKKGENFAETVRKTRIFLHVHVAQAQTAAVAESVEENPRLSIPRRSLQLSIPQTSLHRILHKDLGLKAYKVHFKIKKK